MKHAIPSCHMRLPDGYILRITTPALPYIINARQPQFHRDLHLTWRPVERCRIAAIVLCCCDAARIRRFPAM